MQILNHFGPVDSDLVDKQRYAAWRAAEISKAVREGRPALPPSTPKEEDLPAAHGGGARPPADDDLLPAWGGSRAAEGEMPPAYSRNASMVASAQGWSGER